MATKGLRTLAFAHRTMDEGSLMETEHIESGFEMLGVTAVEDLL
jgi:magnesium-transporting ATPase (P-type)